MLLSRCRYLSLCICHALQVAQGAATGEQSGVGVTARGGVVSGRAAAPAAGGTGGSRLVGGKGGLSSLSSPVRNQQLGVAGARGVLYSPPAKPAVVAGVTGVAGVAAADVSDSSNSGRPKKTQRG